LDDELPNKRPKRALPMERDAGQPIFGELGAQVKMTHIAMLAGVSESTVSRALAGSKLVNPATRKRIEDIAARHSYSIDQRARNLRLSRTGTISVVFPLSHESEQGIADPFFLEMLGNLADALSNRGYDLLLRKIRSDVPRMLADLLREGRTDGVLLIGQSTQHGLINELAQSYRPLVVWGASQPDNGYITVGSDNIGGAAAAVRHLLACGHRRIAFLGNRQLPEVAARYQGYSQALSEAGLAEAPDLLLPVPFDRLGAFAAISGFLDRDRAIDAVFAASDIVAIAAIRALDQHGLKVPHDVAVVGFDDIMVAAAYTPALSTVRQDIALGARTMVDLLFRLIEGEAVHSVELPTTLMVRASSAHAA
jgi:DNA-binding LacI/PurR family transcriptional regulator